MKALAVREIRSALRSPRYYVLLAFFLFAEGYDFCLLFVDDGAVAFRQLLREIAFLVLFAAPLVTSGAFAGERQTGELDQLASEPVSEWTLVLGKALGGLVLLIPIPLSALLPASAAMYYGGVSPAPLLVAVLGLVLMTLACGAAGLFTSSYAAHPASAAASALGLLLLLAFMGVEAAQSEGIPSFLLGQGGREALNPFSLVDYLFRGILDSRPLLLFPLVTVLFLYLAVVFLGSRRWRFQGREGPAGEKGRMERSSLVAARMALVFLPLAVLLSCSHLVISRVRLSVDLSGYLEPSPSFERLLGTLPGRLNIYVVRRHSVSRRRIDDLLDVLQGLHPDRISVAAWNPRKHFARLRPLGLLSPPADGLVIQLGDRVTSIAQDHLDVQSGEAERSIAEAIGKIRPSRCGLTVYFTGGHGETRCGTLERLLSTMGMNSEHISLAGAAPMPPATSSIIAMISPRSGLTELERSRLDDYLAGGGRVLLAFEPEQAPLIASLPRRLNVAASGGRIVDSIHSLAGAGSDSIIVLPAPEHPVTAMTGRLQLVLPGATPIRLVPNREDPLDRILISAPSSARVIDEHSASPATVPATGGDSAVGKEDKAPAATVSGGPGEGNLSSSRTGKCTRGKGRGISIAVTIEGPKLLHPFRFAAIGDTDCLSDRVLQGFPNNALFVQGLFAWLAHRQAPPSFPRKPYRTRVIISRTQAGHLLYALAVAPSFMVIFLGFLAWWRCNGKPGMGSGIAEG